MTSLLGAEIVAFHCYCVISLWLQIKIPKKASTGGIMQNQNTQGLVLAPHFLVREMLSVLWISSNILYLPLAQFSPVSLLLVFQHPALGQYPGQMAQTQLAPTESQVLKETQRKLHWCDCGQYIHSFSCWKYFIAISHPFLFLLLNQQVHLLHKHPLVEKRSVSLFFSQPYRLKASLTSSLT